MEMRIKIFHFEWYELLFPVKEMTQELASTDTQCGGLIGETAAYVLNYINEHLGVNDHRAHCLDIIRRMPPPPGFPRHDSLIPGAVYNVLITHSNHWICKKFNSSITFKMYLATALSIPLGDTSKWMKFTCCDVRMLQYAINLKRGCDIIKIISEIDTKSDMFTMEHRLSQFLTRQLSFNLAHIAHGWYMAFCLANELYLNANPDDFYRMIIQLFKAADSNALFYLIDNNTHALLRRLNEIYMSVIYKTHSVRFTYRQMMPIIVMQNKSLRSSVLIGLENIIKSHGHKDVYAEFMSRFFVPLCNPNLSQKECQDIALSPTTARWPVDENWNTEKRDPQVQQSLQQYVEKHQPVTHHITSDMIKADRNVTPSPRPHSEEPPMAPKRPNKIARCCLERTCV